MPSTDSNIKAEIICDSVNKFGNRLTTMVVTYPRIVLSELNTHRAISKSTASSRAIPIKKQIDKVRLRPFIPSWIGRSQAGMQAAEEVCEEDQDRFKQNWLLAANDACSIAATLDRIGIHKQITNRLLEPFSYVTTILSATDWHNFFYLRCSLSAQPEIMALAFKMLQAYLGSTPNRSDVHIPYSDRMEPGLTEEQKTLVAVARCARISYENHDGKINSEDDIRLANSLIKNKHMSPFEHVAKAHISDTYVGNFQGWVQQRKKIQGENILSMDLEKLLLQRPSWI